MVDAGRPGYAAAAIVAGRVYFNDYDEAAGDYLVRCLNLADGKEIWLQGEAADPAQPRYHPHSPRHRRQAALALPFKFNLSVPPSPLVVDSERVYVTGPYDAGGAMFRVRKSPGGFATERVFAHAADEWNSEVQTPIVFQGHLFAVGKKKRGLFTCVAPTASRCGRARGRPPSSSARSSSPTGCS